DPEEGAQDLRFARLLGVLGGQHERRAEAHVSNVALGRTRHELHLRKLERERPLQGGRHGAVLLDTEEHLLLEGERVGGRLCHIPYGDRAGTFPVEAQAARLLRILGGIRLFLRRLLRGPPARGALVATAARKSQERRSQQKGPKRSAMHGYVHLHFPIVGFTGRVTAHDGSGSFVPSLGKKQSGGARSA